MQAVQFCFLLSLCYVSRGDILEAVTESFTVNQTMLHMEKMGALQKKLFQNYSSLIRPVHNGSTQVKVKTALVVQHFEVDDVQETITVHGHLYLKWEDEFMSWNPSDYADKTKIHVQLWQLWTPDINVYNAPAGGESQIWYRHPVWVHSNGNIVLNPRVTFKVSCSFDYTDYPTDIQTCKIKLGSFKYIYEKMDLIHISKKINFHMAWDETERWHVNGWKLVTSTTDKLFYGVEGMSKDPVPDETNFIEFSFIITVQRHSPYFHVLFLLPAVVTSILTIFSFFMNSSKLQLLTLVLSMLTQGVFLRTVLKQLPPASGAVPRIVHYYSFNLCMTFIGIILVIMMTSLLSRPDLVPTKLEQICRLTDWFAPADSFGRLRGSARSIKGGLEHQKFENENDDDDDDDDDDCDGGGGNKESEKENQENVSPTRTPETKNTTGVSMGWGDIFDWLCRGCFTIYAVAYLLAMFSLLT